MDDCTSRFLDIFNEIEKFLKTIVKPPDGTKFGDLLTDACNQTKVLPKYAVAVREVESELRRLSELRNFLVHKHGHNRALALPHPSVVTRIEAINNSLQKPASIVPMFAKDVVRCSLEDPIGHVVQKMFKNDYSQIPVYHKTELHSLLITDTVARWLGDSFAILDGRTQEVPVREVLGFAEHKYKTYRLLAPEATVLDALGCFERCSRRGDRLDAILITQDGKPHNPIVGIITAFDIPKLHAALWQPSGEEAVEKPE